MGGVIGGNAISPNFGGEAVDLLTSRFEISIAPLTQIPIGIESANAQVHLLLELTKSGGQLDTASAIVIDYLSGTLRRVAGANLTNIKLEESPDNVNWSLIEQIRTASNIFGSQERTSGVFGSGTDAFFFRIASFNSDATTSGEFLFFKGYIELAIPTGYTIERLI